MQETRIAKRYATALFRLAEQRGVVEEVDEQLHQLGLLFRDRRFTRLLLHPQIPRKQKEQVLLRVSSFGVHQLVTSLLKLMLRKQRIDHFPAVAGYYDLLTDRSRGVEEITVISAVELEDEDYQEILTRADAYSSFPDLRLIKKIRPEIIGGAIVELGRDKVVDMSVRTALTGLRRRLVKHRYY